MSKDFKTGQIKTSKIIGKDEEKTLFYSNKQSTNDEGGTSVSSAGNDVSFYFHGTSGKKDTDVTSTGDGVVLFGGDVVVSGTLYAERQIVEVDESVAGSFTVASNTKTHAFFVDGSSEQVMILSGGAPTSPSEYKYSDTNFFVSGTIGSKGSTTKGTSVFGGDVVISGTLFGGSPLIIGEDARISNTDGSTQYFNFGASDSAAGYGIRSNSGIMEFKDFGSPAWSAFSGAGAGSTGVAGMHQVSDGAGGFSISNIKYDSGLDETAVGFGSTFTFAGSQLAVSTKASLNKTALSVLNIDPNHTSPAFRVDSNTQVGVPDVDFSTPAAQNLIAIVNSTSGTPNVTTIDFNNDSLSIENKEDQASTALIGNSPVHPSGNYNIIKSEVVIPSNSPFISFLTNASIVDPLASSNDINFFVSGSAGSLGPLGPKGSAKFGGDVLVQGCVARGGILHLSLNSVQLYSLASSGPYNAALDPTFVQNVIWNNTIVNDPVFYSVSGKDITINKQGIYKISYSVNFSQLLPIANRTNMKTFLNDTSTLIQNAIDCSEAWSYGRGTGAGDTVGKMSNVCTTTASFAAGDVINLNVAFQHGVTNQAIQVNMRANQTWIILEKIA